MSCPRCTRPGTELRARTVVSDAGIPLSDRPLNRQVTLASYVIGASVSSSLKLKPQYLQVKFKSVDKTPSSTLEAPPKYYLLSSLILITAGVQQLD